jgi:hypothetical protein
MIGRQNLQDRTFLLGGISPPFLDSQIGSAAGDCTAAWLLFSADVAFPGFVASLVTAPDTRTLDRNSISNRWRLSR